MILYTALDDLNMSYAELKKRKLSDYKYFLDYRLRWLGGDDGIRES